MDSTRSWQRHFLNICSKRFLLIALLLGGLMPAANAKVLLKTSLSPNPTQVGEQVLLRIDRIEDLSSQPEVLHAPNPELPVIPGLSLLSSQMGQNIATQNQQMRVMLTYQYLLVATKAGEYQIPALDMGQDQGKSIKTNPLVLHVIAPPGRFSPLWFFLIILPLGVLGIWLWRRNSSKVSITQEPDSIENYILEPEIEAIELPTLDTLRNSFKQDLKEIFPELHLAWTSQEIITYLQKQIKTSDLIQELENFLNQCDHLRFQAQNVDNNLLLQLNKKAKTLIIRLKE
jgi:hypothetical protein